MSTIISSGENYDISFASNYVANAQKGAYADLTELAPKYAKEAYDQLDESYIKGNTIDGKLYAFPVNGNIYAQQVLTFNKEYLDKYDLDISGIESYADAEDVLKKFKEEEPNIAPFAIGQTFNVSGEETQGPMDYGDTILSNAAGHELVSRPITKQLKSTGQAQMANFVVANVSKNKEKAVEVLGLLNSDPELLNGLVWGVEGEAWEKIEGEDNKIRLLDGYLPNTRMAAWNTGNNMILYTQESITDDMIKERDENIANAEASPILGFNFKTDNVKTEITNIANVMNRYKASLATGTIDPEENVPKLNEELKTAGWEKVRDEMQKQFDEYRASQE